MWARMSRVSGKLLALVALSGAMFALTGCGLRADVASHFEPRSVIPGVVVATQSSGPSQGAGPELLTPGGMRPGLSAQAALTKTCRPGPNCFSKNPSRVTLAISGGELGGTGGKLVWVFEYDNVNACPDLGGPVPVNGQTTAPHPTGPCTAYTMVDAYGGENYGTLLVGW
jgi:hypothetical protein